MLGWVEREGGWGDSVCEGAGVRVAVRGWAEVRVRAAGEG